MTATIAERVAKGAAWLDKERPDWHHQINLGRLDMADGCLCVLGQVFAESARVADYAFEMDGFEFAVDVLGVPAVEDGFNVTVDWNRDMEVAYAMYAELGAEWKRLIAERRAAS